jgi:hypothetical protein
MASSSYLFARTLIRAPDRCTILRDSSWTPQQTAPRLQSTAHGVERGLPAGAGKGVDSPNVLREQSPHELLRRV